jgi:hypothetical protein
MTDIVRVDVEICKRRKARRFYVHRVDATGYPDMVSSLGVQPTREGSWDRNASVPGFLASTAATAAAAPGGRETHRGKKHEFSTVLSDLVDRMASHSWRKASIGLRLAALRAGKNPK